MKTITDLRKSVGRELGLRRNVYPKWVSTGKLTQEESDHEIECMDQLYGYLKKAEQEGVFLIGVDLATTYGDVTVKATFFERTMEYEIVEITSSDFGKPE